MMIASIVLASHKYESGQWAFLSALVNWQDLPGGEARYINEYATRWTDIYSKQVPDFFDRALRFDLSHQTAITGAILRQIQLIGNAVCAAGGSVTSAEKEIVRNYIEFLEEKVKTAKGEAVVDRISREPLTNALSDFVAEPEVQYDQIQSIPPVIQPPVVFPQVFSPPRRRAELRWIPADQPINIGRFDIPSGMIYVSDGQASVEEASAINLQLPVGEANNGSHQLNYYPNYSFITPEQRFTYLEWLASGRKDSNPDSRELGYVFIFFYGLERRLLVDKAQDQEVVAELVRLLQHYGPYTRSRSLQSYTSQLITFGDGNRGWIIIVSCWNG
jgi:hypothetical protein